MTAPRRLKADLPAVLAELYVMPVTPDYRDEVLERTARTRQRPAWTFLERWLPMSVALPLPRQAARSWLPAAVLLLMLALLAALAVGAALSRPSRLPAAVAQLPHNGLLAFDSMGRIKLADVTSSEVREVPNDGGADSGPAWSPDGKHLAFMRLGDEGAIMVADADGSNAIQVASAGPPQAGYPPPVLYEWSPDSSRLAMITSVDGRPSLSVVAADGSGVTPLDVGMEADWPDWDPSGDAIFFHGRTEAGVPGLYRVDLGSGAVEGPLLQVDATTPLFAKWGAQEFLWDPSVSPDGSSIVYSTVVELLPGQAADSQNARARRMRSDGTGDHEVAVASDSLYETTLGDSPWSPDGSRYLIRAVRPDTATPAADDSLGGSLVIMSAEDDSVLLATEPDPDGFNWVEWAPDGSTILLVGGSPIHAQLIDPTTGAATELDLDIRSGVDWQPLMP